LGKVSREVAGWLGGWVFLMLCACEEVGRVPSVLSCPRTVLEHPVCFAFI
jgi:hypothetical protein